MKHCANTVKHRPWGHELDQKSEYVRYEPFVRKAKLTSHNIVPGTIHVINTHRDRVPFKDNAEYQLERPEVRWDTNVVVQYCTSVFLVSRMFVVSLSVLGLCNRRGDFSLCSFVVGMTDFGIGSVRRVEDWSLFVTFLRTVLLLPIRTPPD